MIPILTVLNLVCLYICLSAIFLQGNCIKVAILTLSAFSFLYIIVSGLFFWGDAFSFIRVLGSLLIVLIPLVVYTLRNTHAGIKKLVQMSTVHVTEVVLIIITILLSVHNFELYSSEQDQGLYQAEAIELYMGNYEIEHDFEEYQIFESSEERDAYQKMVKDGIPGFYPISAENRYTIVNKMERLSDVSGMYHGIQTFPAVLALGGRLFGLENMMQIQTIFLVCAVMLIYYALFNIGLSTGKRIAALAVFLLSPLVLWISKTAFTEMILTLCMAFYLFLLTETDSWQKHLLLSLPWIVFSYVHVSFLIIYPVFVLIHVLLYFQSKQKEFLYVNVLISVGLITGYFMMARIAPVYFFNQLSRLYWRNIITSENILYWVCFGAAAVCIFSLLMVKFKAPDLICKKITIISKFVIFIMLAVIIYNIIVTGYFLAPEGKWSWLRPYYGSGFFNAVSHSTFFAFAMATGFLVMPCILWYIVKYYKTIWISPYEMGIYFLFVYCILFQSAFIRKEVSYYYYYSRYLVLYVPIICLAFAVILKNLKVSVLWGILAASVACMSVFDVALLTQNDQTQLEWQSLQDLNLEIQDDSAIILDSEAVSSLLAAPLRAITGEAIFPALEDLEKEVRMLHYHYQNVYYLSLENSVAGNSLEDRGFELLYRDKYIYQSIDSRPGKISVLGLFPVKFPTEIRELILYGLETVSVGMDSIGVVDGEKTDEYIMSTGAPGLVVFGPYVNLLEGNYILKIPITIESQTQASLGGCQIGNISEGIGSVLPRMPIEAFLHNDERGTVLKIPFHLDKYTEELEVLIDATEGSVFKIYPYQYRRILYGEVPLDIFNTQLGIEQVTLEYVESTSIEISLDQFYSQNDVSQDDISVRSSENAGFLLYGPYIPVKPANYQINVTGELYSGELNEYSFFDIVAENGEKNIISIANLNQFITGNKFELSADFEIAEFLDDCEFRVFVNDGVQLEITQVTLELHTEDAS